MFSKMFAAICSIIVALGGTTTSFACSRPGAPQFIQSRWTSPNTVELEIFNKSQASEGSLYYEFSINGRYSDRQRIENPHFDQRLKVNLDTNHYISGTVFENLRVQLWARRVNNDCRSGPSEEYVTVNNPSYHRR